jgi:cell wall-associated NlpC family hydrolase
MPAKNKPTAIHKLNPSRLDTAKQMEMLGGDVDIEKFHIQVEQGAGIDITQSITDAMVDRTIEGASTLTVSVDDTDDRAILTSGRLVKRADVNIDGLWWTLVSVKKTGRQLSLVFEEREVNLLRRYNKPIFADRSKINRAQFVLRMIREVQETKLRWVIPELHIKQVPSDVQGNQVLVRPDGTPLSSSNDLQDAATSQGERGTGISTKNSSLRVKGVRATPEQIKNANIILATGEAMKAPRRVLVCSIMVAIDESTIHNLIGGDRDSVGVFQQRRSQGWPASRNVETDARAFFRQAIIINGEPAYKGVSNATLCQAVQISGTADGSNYARYQDEAERFVNAFNRNPTTLEKQVTSGAGQVDANTNLFMRGQVTSAKGMTNAFLLTPENSWNCMQRLANDVNWRAFCVSGTIYFVSDHWLFKSMPFMTISEDSPGIDWIDCDYDEGKPRATVTVTAHLHRWAAPPGSTVEISDMGILDGKWLVDTVSRSIFDTVGTITLVKPLPLLPEPIALSGIPKGFMVPNIGGKGGNNKEINLTEANAIQKRVVAYAHSQLGVPYQWGGEVKGVGFDCSGLAQAAYHYAEPKIKLPRTSQTQWNFGVKLTRNDILQPGDLVFFEPGADGPGHVGIYVGHGNMIDAPHTGAFVRVDYNFRQNWGGYVGATRPWLKLLPGGSGHGHPGQNP